MIVRSDVIEKIEYEDYGKDPTVILADFQQEDPTYTEKDVQDYLTLEYVEDQLQWASLDEGEIHTLKVFKKGEEYWGTDWIDSNGMDSVDAYIYLEPLVKRIVTRYFLKSSPEVPTIAVV